MKNFYELLDIKKEVDITLTVKPVMDTQFPKIKININEELLHDDIVKEIMTMKYKTELLKNLNIKIELYDKDYKKFKNLAIIIESLKIDFFEIIPHWTHLITYENDQNFAQPTNHLGFNGTWSLQINEPFYRWKHKITGQGWLLEP
jgi:hypothetical protein